MNFIKNKKQAVQQLIYQTAILFSVILLSVGCTLAQKNQTRNGNSQNNALVGRWVSDEATVEIRADGKLTINGEEFSYKIKNSVITIFGDEGIMQFPFELEGDTMVVSVEDREVVYTRENRKNVVTSQKETRGANPPELVGKWCYMANVNGGSGNTRMSNRCFTLYANGTYEYYSESSSGGNNGSYASQEYDSGRWSATATTLTAYSKSNGTITYPLQKRNHPKTGDPMLLVDGDAYVTAYQKQPW